MKLPVAFGARSVSATYDAGLMGTLPFLSPSAKAGHDAGGPCYAAAADYNRKRCQVRHGALIRLAPGAAENGGTLGLPSSASDPRGSPEQSCGAGKLHVVGTWVKWIPRPNRYYPKSIPVPDPVRA